MAYDEYLLERVDRYLSERKVEYFYKKMMGGIVFMVNEKMCVCIDKDKKSGDDRLMVRIGTAYYEEALKDKNSRAMDFTGTPMKGFVFIGPDGFDLDEDLEFWIDKALEYNPLAKKSPSKSKKKKK